MPENENQAAVPYFIHEGMVARMERIIKMLTRTIIAVLAVAIILFIVNNMIWMKYVETQRQEAVVEEVLTDAGVHEQPDTGTD